MSTPNISQVGEMDLWIHLRETFTNHGGTVDDLRALLDPTDNELGVRKMVGLCRQNPVFNLSQGIIRIDWTMGAISTESELTVAAFQPNPRATAKVYEIGYVCVADLIRVTNDTLLNIVEANSTSYNWCGAEVALGFREQHYLFPFCCGEKVIFPKTVLQNTRSDKYAAAYDEPNGITTSNIGSCWFREKYYFKDGRTGIEKRTYLAYWKNPAE